MERICITPDCSVEYYSIVEEIQVFHDGLINYIMAMGSEIVILVGVTSLCALLFLVLYRVKYGIKTLGGTHG